MNKNIDLTKILDRCPKGTKLYSSIFGVVSFIRINISNIRLIELETYNKLTNSIEKVYYTEDGIYYFGYKGECTLFPSKDQRDWSKFVRFWDKQKVEKFDVNTLQPFDKVLARDYTDEPWAIDLFSHKINGAKIIRGVGYCWNYCIPYNEETKHLIGTKENCPEYYKWWEK